jgi:hypothetical protein
MNRPGFDVVERPLLTVSRGRARQGLEYSSPFNARLASLGPGDQGLRCDVRLIPPVYVRPFVKRGKADAADGEAICEAAPRKKHRLSDLVKTYTIV